VDYQTIDQNARGIVTAVGKQEGKAICMSTTLDWLDKKNLISTDASWVEVQREMGRFPGCWLACIVQCLFLTESSQRNKQW